MSLIIDIPMPKNCNNCVFQCYYRHKYFMEETRPDECPIIAEIPSHHGRLIDADELSKNVLKWMPGDPCGVQEKEFPFEEDICVSMMMEIEEAETIIEAEK